eukprot:CAMPEP_0204575890 /NCGR_PEP_ID=MMETSP0661-20131031/41458_1 /ASSEMBLY_ACC=CAM_ASM_000606 /TAXON_ID=109239 /ORGANISM="Alexandrium margalefi, Strain AMGDE01CS-322" /LENGTH=41 /DNA_ID= /DNA_START= /DNA_END= /DNA_ORIENTATION=
MPSSAAGPAFKLMACAPVTAEPPTTGRLRLRLRKRQRAGRS